MVVAQSVSPSAQGRPKCNKDLLFQANRPHMCYNQLGDTVSNVTRSLQNPPLLSIRSVTYARDSRTQSCAFDGSHKSPKSWPGHTIEHSHHKEQYCLLK